MSNGKQPKTDREWLMQIDSKIEGLSGDIKQQRADTVGIFGRLRTVELDAEKRSGVCQTHQAATQTLVEKIATIPNVNKAIRLWGALIVLVQAMLGTLYLWKG